MIFLLNEANAKLHTIVPTSQSGKQRGAVIDHDSHVANYHAHVKQHIKVTETKQISGRTGQGGNNMSVQRKAAVRQQACSFWSEVKRISKDQLWAEEGYAEATWGSVKSAAHDVAHPITTIEHTAKSTYSLALMGAHFMRETPYQRAAAVVHAWHAIKILSAREAYRLGHESPEAYWKSIGSMGEHTQLFVATTVIPAGGIGKVEDVTDAANVVRGVEDVSSTSRAVTRARVTANVNRSKTARDGTGFTRFSRKATALNYYLKNGFDLDAAVMHMRGIDFSKPVFSTVIKKGQIYKQYYLPASKEEELAILEGKGNISPGNYFTDLGTPASKTGIYTSGRMPMLFFARTDISVLQSTALAMIDDYSMAEYGMSIDTEGGGVQYFSPNNKDWEPQL